MRVPWIHSMTVWRERGSRENQAGTKLFCVPLYFVVSLKALPTAKYNKPLPRFIRITLCVAIEEHEERMMVAGRGRKRVFHNRERKKGDELERASERERELLWELDGNKRDISLFSLAAEAGREIQSRESTPQKTPQKRTTWGC